MNEQTISDKIINLLPHGERKAIKSTELCKKLSIEDRALRQAVAGMRKNRVPVLASSDGYFLPDDAAGVDECQIFIRRQLS